MLGTNKALPLSKLKEEFPQIYETFHEGTPKKAKGDYQDGWITDKELRFLLSYGKKGYPGSLMGIEEHRFWGLYPIEQKMLVGPRWHKWLNEVLRYAVEHPGEMLFMNNYGLSFKNILYLHYVKPKN